MSQNDIERRLAALEERRQAEAASLRAENERLRSLLADGTPGQARAAAPRRFTRRGMLAMAGVGGAALAAGAAATRLTGLAHAAATATVVNYQGRLTNAGGNPLTGTYPMTFALYTTATGGTPFWQEQRAGASAVPVTNGLFSVYLGSITPIDPTQLTQAAYLGITVGTDAEMTPRELLGTVPYAMHAQNADAVGGFPASLTPAANSILPLDANERMSGSYVKPPCRLRRGGAGSLSCARSWTAVPVPPLLISFTCESASMAIVCLTGFFNMDLAAPNMLGCGTFLDGALFMGAAQAYQNGGGGFFAATQSIAGPVDQAPTRFNSTCGPGLRSISRGIAEARRPSWWRCSAGSSGALLKACRSCTEGDQAWEPMI